MLVNVIYIVKLLYAIESVSSILDWWEQQEALFSFNNLYMERIELFNENIFL